MDSEQLIERVKRWGGIPSNPQAERAIVAALRSLREAMFDDEAAALAEELPAPFRPWLHASAARNIVEAEQLYDRAARIEGVTRGVAREHVQAVCQAVASLLSPTLLARISRVLPDSPELFLVADRSSHPPSVVRAQARTLAEGRPSSPHPLSEARAGSEHPLSEARPPKLEATTIAEGRAWSEKPISETRPGSEHPLSEARPPARRP
jgi:uncharacterized protein (DUF2267 family)